MGTGLHLHLPGAPAARGHARYRRSTARPVVSATGFGIVQRRGSSVGNWLIGVNDFREIENE